jgi:hypothetical protein
MSLSEYPFCHGDRGKIGRSRMPIARSRSMTTAIHAIPIANDISWRLLPAIGFGQLTGNPLGARACGHTQPQKLAAGMLQDQKSIQQPKRDRRDYEQIHRRNAVGMIAQKGLPALRRRLPSPRHVFCHGGLPDIDAKLEKFAVDARCSPKRVRDAHVANQLANVRRCLCRPPCGRDF